MNAGCCIVPVVGTPRVKSCRRSVVVNVPELNVCWLISPFNDDGACAAHGMRGDGVGVGDIDDVQGDAWSPGDMAAVDDGGGAGCCLSCLFHRAALSEWTGSGKCTEKSRTVESQRSPGKMRRGDILSARKSMLWPEAPLVGWPRAPRESGSWILLLSDE